MVSYIITGLDAKGMFLHQYEGQASLTRVNRMINHMSRRSDVARVTVDLAV